MNRACELGVGLIGLYLIVSILAALPGQLAAVSWLPDMMRRASDLVGKTSAQELGSASNLAVRGLLATALSLLPPIGLLLARRRVAAWLMPVDGTPTAIGAKGVDLARVGLALLGAYLFTTGCVGIAGVTADLVAPYNPLEHHGVLGFVSSTGRVIFGWVLWRFSSPLAGWAAKSWPEEHGA